jgi:DNA repair protein RecN (Recombination protein N)
MLKTLRITNFILIESLTLDLAAGICLLTGETGAGKSIIIDAVLAVLGGRVSTDLIRAGASRASLEATFALDPSPALRAILETHGIEPAVDGELTLSREVTPKGSRCRIEGQLVPQSALKEVGETLVDVLGQHENTLLTRSREHLRILDEFAGSEAMAARAETSRLYAKLLSLRNELSTLDRSAAERERQRDFWQYQLAEIEAAEVSNPGEADELKAERQILANAEDLKRELTTAYGRLYGGDDIPSVTDQIDEVLSTLRDGAELDPELATLAEAVEGALSTLQDTAREIRRRAERLEADPERLSELEGRLDLLRDLLRKYGPSVEDMWALAERLRQDLGTAESDSTRQEEIRSELKQTTQKLEVTARRLTELREAAARHMEASVGQELKDLGMKEARFFVAFKPHEPIGAEGAQTAEFMLAPNPGEPPRPLAKTASGGELARLMLALKTVLHRADGTPTLIFDEVDTGISGRAAQVVAQKISSLGSRSQILLITHMPAIAAIADRHWHIEKRIAEGRTSVALELLEGDAVVRELAHIASGDAGSAAALSHAQELLDKARQFKLEAAGASEAASALEATGAAVAPVSSGGRRK